MSWMETAMTKLYFEPITVEFHNDHPRLFVWRKNIYRITAVLKRWMISVDWWRQEISRQYYTVECDDLGTYDIYRDTQGWFLERLHD